MIELSPLRELIRLDFEVIRAYQAAIKGAPATLRAKLASLMADHEEHARLLVGAPAGGRPPQPEGRLAKGFAGLKTEAQILDRLLAVEEEAVATYEAALRQLPAEIGERLVDDERRHVAWLAQRLGPRRGRRGQ